MILAAADDKGLINTYVLRKIFQHLLRSELLVNTSILISGTALAQLIPILLQPLLRRYFPPEFFGAYTVYLSIVGILLVVSSLRYELAIILPRKDKEAAGVFFLAIIINLLFNILLLVIILALNEKIMAFLNLGEDYGHYLYLVPLGTFLFSSYQSINYWLIRKKRFFQISVNKFVRRGFEGAAQIGSNFLKISHGLIYGDLTGHVANVTYGIFQAVRSGLSVRMFSRVKIRYVSAKYAEYPKYNLVPAFMSACSYLLPAILINKFYSSEYTGYFDLSKLLLSVPLSLISASIANVLLQRISEKDKLKTSIRKDLISILAFVFAAATLEVVIIKLWAEEIFSLFFGPGWEVSSAISKILIWAFAYNFIVASFSSIYISLKKIKLLSFWQLLYFLSILSLSFFNYLPFNSFLRVYTLIEIICCSLSTLFMLYIIINYERKLIGMKAVNI